MFDLRLLLNKVPVFGNKWLKIFCLLCSVAKSFKVGSKAALTLLQYQSFFFSALKITREI